MADEGGAMQEGMDRLVAALKQHAGARPAWRYKPYPLEQHSTIYLVAATAAVRQTFRPPPKPK
jgi:hypothetical protein